MKSKSIREEFKKEYGNAWINVHSQELWEFFKSKLTQLLDEIPCEEIDPTKDKLLKDLESLHDPSYPYVDRIGEIRGHNQKAQEVREWRDKKKGEL